MNHERIYQYRFRGVSKVSKVAAWKEISSFIWNRMGRPAVMLDPAAGEGEFINLAPAAEKWAVDKETPGGGGLAEGIRFIRADIMQAELPEKFFDGIFISNFLEHLSSQDEVAAVLEKMYRCTKPGGTIAVMGPNFRYAYRGYFDFADHRTILTDVSAAEHLFGAGFEITNIHPRFLPLSFRSGPPAYSILVKAYLQLPLLWKIAGQQFLVIAKK